MDNLLNALVENNEKNIYKYTKEYKNKLNEPINHRGDTCLIIAIRSGNYTNVDYLLGNNADIDVCSKHASPISEAARCGYSDILNLLLDNTTQLNDKSLFGYTALFEAIQENHNDCIKLLLDAGVDPNKIASEDAGFMHGYTPLMLASHFSRTECIKYLIDAKANVNYIREQTGDTALIVAARHNNDLAIYELIKNGADRTIVNKRGETAVDIIRNLECKKELTKKYRYCVIS